MTGEMVAYYARRAAEYDAIYALPHWQRDLESLRRLVPASFAGRRVFEVACGTGYWTQFAAREAASVLATDLNEETLALARARPWPRANVTFRRVDAYTPSPEPLTFDAGLAAFWLSHVDLGRMAEFLAAFHSHLAPGAPVLMFDERDTADRRPRASRRDDAGNRYEPRRLASGERFEIIKNFYPPARLRELVAPHARDLVHEELDALWLLRYRAA
jgi:demethylmenaquinone methyltransferase/2-methoxy-6-polyprenyl-1,4-benzoquinol methylase